MRFRPWVCYFSSHLNCYGTGLEYQKVNTKLKCDRKRGTHIRNYTPLPHTNAILKFINSEADLTSSELWEI